MRKVIAKNVITKATKVAKDIKNYLIMDNKTPDVILGKATGIAAANRKVDKLDNAYGASRYKAVRIDKVDYSKKTVTAGGKEFRVSTQYLPTKPKGKK